MPKAPLSFPSCGTSEPSASPARRRFRRRGGQPIGPERRRQAVGEPASPRTLAEIAASFARAAADARAARFDGVDCTARTATSSTSSTGPPPTAAPISIGGGAAGRVRFSAEVAAAVRAAVGPDFPVAFRFSQWKVGQYDARIAQTPDELAAFLTPLAEAGVSLFHVSTPVLAAGLRGLGPYPGRLDQAPDRASGHRHRLGQCRHAVPGQPGRGRPAHAVPRTAGRPVPPRRVRPGRPRPRGAGRSGVGQQAGRCPAGRDPPLRQVRGSSCLTSVARPGISSRYADRVRG